MSQKIICPHCKKEFPMEEGLTSHFKTLQDNHLKKIETQENEKRKKDLERYQNLEKENLENKEKIKKFNEERTKIDEENKKHYETLTETKIKKNQEDVNMKHNEEREKWNLEKIRYNKQIQTMQQTVNQGSTVDQGSGSEVQLGEYLKKIYKDKNDKNEEYE